MDAKIKEEWLAALRSGSYEQTSGKLRKTGIGFCCLGVLCDVLTKRGIGRWSGDIYCHNIEGSSAFLPTELRDEIGLSIEDQRDLANLNDKMDVSFSYIANIIEANL